LSATHRINRLIAYYLFGLFVSLYLLTSAGDIVLDSDSSRARYEVTKSIVERFDLSIPHGLGIKGHDGRDYSWYGLGYSVLSVPFYGIGKSAGINPEKTVSILNQLTGAATGVLVFLFSVALGYTRRTSLTVALFYGLGTMAWPLAKQPFDHTIETFFILLSIYLMYRHAKKRSTTTHLLASAVSLGIAFITRPTSILAMPPLFLLMYCSHAKKTNLKNALKLTVRSIILFLIAFIPFLLITFWYNYYRFGSVFESGFSLMAERTNIDFFTGTPLLTGLEGFITSPGKGFFYYSPVALLFFFSIRSFLRRDPGLALSFIGFILSYLLFHSKNIYWHGDWAWGPRYLLATIPFFVIPIAELLAPPVRQWQSLRRKAVYFIFTASFIIQIAAVCVTPAKYFIKLQLEDNVKFTVVKGDGVQPIFEPPPETYFDWHKSPIAAQFRSIYEISQKIKHYKYVAVPEETKPVETTVKLNVFEFWWLHNYIVNKSYDGFVVALALLLQIVYCLSRLKKLTIESPLVNSEKETEC
jgi:4-amino-4-deoxy-L-arabinose transferase-like glycosyltransferase